MTIATLPDEFETLMFQIIIAALEEEGRIPVHAPWTGLDARMNRSTLAGLTIEPHADGWGGELLFKAGPAETPKSIGTPQAHACATPQEAFVKVATTICLIVSGSPKLPGLLTTDYF
tara:strand:- start:500 stop:850 length:351 start_codon:yes stop_codon:yes gene_type:complete